MTQALAAVISLALVLLTTAQTWTNHSLVFGRPVERKGFYAQVALGLGGGPNHEGLLGAVELGASFKNGITLGALHVFLQNKNIIGPYRGPDGLVGSLVEVKIPLFRPEIEAKIAAGLGGVLDELRPLLIPGFGLAYGVDLHLPIFRASGPTLGVLFFHAFVPAHYFTVAGCVGYTFF
jgi:hypothetical protein